MLQSISYTGIAWSDGTLRTGRVDFTNQFKQMLLDNTALISGLQNAIRVVLMQKRVSNSGV